MAVSSLLIPRSELGAAAPRKSIVYMAKDLFICHHSGDKGTWPTPAEEKAAMWFWQHYHFQAWDAADIMYNAVIFPSGRAYEGRYGGWLANGGGAFGCNQRGFGVALAGDFNTEMPSIEALNTLIHLALEARSAIQVPAERYWGHRDCWVYDSRNKGNDCPGNMFYAWLPTLQAVVAKGGQEAQKELEEFMQARTASPIATEHHFPDVWLDKFNTHYLHVQNRGKGEATVRCYAVLKAVDGGGYIDLLGDEPIRLAPDGQAGTYVDFNIGGRIKEKTQAKSVTLSVHSYQPVVCVLREG